MTANTTPTHHGKAAVKSNKASAKPLSFLLAMYLSLLIV